MVDVKKQESFREIIQEIKRTFFSLFQIILYFYIIHTIQSSFATQLNNSSISGFNHFFHNFFHTVICGDETHHLFPLQIVLPDFFIANSVSYQGTIYSQVCEHDLRKSVRMTLCVRLEEDIVRERTLQEVVHESVSPYIGLSPIKDFVGDGDSSLLHFQKEGGEIPTRCVGDNDDSKLGERERVTGKV
jgi:hypothetical protein